jgi:hypothetical protein
MLQKIFLEDKTLRSKITLALLPFLLLLAFPVMAQQRQAVSSLVVRPKLAMVSFEHSFGTVKPGTPLKFTFRVKNRGNADLEIMSVSPSCGCTTSNFDKTIAPGKTGSITLAVEKTDSYNGEIVKTATVKTNDPDRPSLTLTLRATFKSE